MRQYLFVNNGNILQTSVQPMNYFVLCHNQWTWIIEDNNILMQKYKVKWHHHMACRHQVYTVKPAYYDCIEKRWPFEPGVSWYSLSWTQVWLMSQTFVQDQLYKVSTYCLSQLRLLFWWYYRQVWLYFRFARPLRWLHWSQLMRCRRITCWTKWCANIHYIRNSAKSIWFWLMWYFQQYHMGFPP